MIKHKKKREIEAKLFTLGKRLRAEGLSEERVKAKLGEERVRMQAELERSTQKLDLRDKHQAALAKQRDMDQLKSALRISDRFEEGAAFDLELQERKREARLAEKDLKRKEAKRERKEAKKER